MGLMIKVLLSMQEVAEVHAYWNSLMEALTFPLDKEVKSVLKAPMKELFSKEGISVKGNETLWHGVPIKIPSDLLELMID